MQIEIDKTYCIGVTTVVPVRVDFDNSRIWVKYFTETGVLVFEGWMNTASLENNKNLKEKI